MLVFLFFYFYFGLEKSVGGQLEFFSSDDGVYIFFSPVFFSPVFFCFFLPGEWLVARLVVGSSYPGFVFYFYFFHPKKFPGPAPGAHVVRFRRRGGQGGSVFSAGCFFSFFPVTFF